jgi:ACR3 family arsenite transporter
VPPPAGIGFLEKWLSVWVTLCTATGLLQGNIKPGVFEALAALEVASVNHRRWASLAAGRQW